MAKRDLNNSPNAKMIKSVTTKGTRSANSKATVDLDLDLIDENPDNSKIFNMNDIRRLEITITKEGFAGAIEVYEKPDGRFEISAGHRRVQAVRNLGWKTIPAIISPYPDKLTVGNRLISSNINNREMTPMDWARAIAYKEDLLREELGLSKGQKSTDVNIQEELAKYFDMSTSYISRYKALNKLVPELQEIAEKNIAPWYQLSLIASGKDKLSEKAQKQLAKEILKWAADNKTYDKDGDSSKPQVSAGQLQSLINRILYSPTVKERAKKEYKPVEDVLTGVTPEPVIGGRTTTITKLPDFTFDPGQTDQVFDSAPVDSKNISEPEELIATDYDVNNIVSMLDSYDNYDFSSLNKAEKKKLQKSLNKILKMIE